MGTEHSQRDRPYLCKGQLIPARHEGFIGEVCRTINGEHMNDAFEAGRTKHEAERLNHSCFPRPIFCVLFLASLFLLRAPLLFAAVDTTIKGTTSNSTNAALEVTNSSDADLLFVRNDGNVGVGDATPDAVLQLKAGTATANTAPLKLTSGTNLTAAEAGAMEYDGTVFYTSPGASMRGVSPSVIYAVNGADLTGANNNTAQPIFNTAYDTLTVPANTMYFFELYLSVTNGATTCTKALDLDDGTATFTSIRY